MKFTRTERLILSNQYRILEALYPDEARDFAAAGEALTRGYELHYVWIAEHVYEDVMTEEECREVLDILQMYDYLKIAYDDLADKSGIDERRLRFGGFDGNSEGKQVGYARYFCTHDGPRYQNLDKGDDFNSHCPSLDRHRRMLAEWMRSADRLNLAKDDILRITTA